MTSFGNCGRRHSGWALAQLAGRALGGQRWRRSAGHPCCCSSKARRRSRTSHASRPGPAPDPRPARAALPQNVVATVNLDCKLDLKSIALHARNAEYNPKRFAAVIMRIREPKSTALIFASGKMVGGDAGGAVLLGHRRTAKRVPGSTMPSSPGCVGALKQVARLPQVCTGAKSETESRLAARKVSPRQAGGLLGMRSVLNTRCCCCRVRGRAGAHTALLAAGHGGRRVSWGWARRSATAGLGWAGRRCVPRTKPR